MVEQLEDPAFVDRLLAFPARLMAAARAATNDSLAAGNARDAVAVELLLTCSMRVGNLGRVNAIQRGPCWCRLPE